MKSYQDHRGQPADFRVSYRFLSPVEGGRANPPQQHVRWDFLYQGDDPLTDGISMIWPEFIDMSGAVLPAGEVPMSGFADMFIVDPERRDFHSSRIAPGVKGFFVEGPKRVAECEVIAVTGLHTNPRGS